MQLRLTSNHSSMQPHCALRQLSNSFLVGLKFRPSAVPPIATQFRYCRSCDNSIIRHGSSSASSTQWKSRQWRDIFAREARVQGLKSRAAFKLIELNKKHKLFKPGQTVVDLGFAPGSWSQVAADCTSPDGRVIGVDVIPAQPPRGVSTIQGNFLSPDIQDEVRAYVRDLDLGRPRKQVLEKRGEGLTSEELDEMEQGYIDMERQAHLDGGDVNMGSQPAREKHQDQALKANLPLKERDLWHGRVVDVVLSDMSEPWEQTTGFYKKSLSDPYFRMMNTSGNAFRDHAGSIDLCMAALMFAFDTLKTNGHFLCKFYQGSEDKELEIKLKRLFANVHREKPNASRYESREAYFVALCRKEMPTLEEVLREG